MIENQLRRYYKRTLKKKDDNNKRKKAKTVGITPKFTLMGVSMELKAGYVG